MQCDLILQGIPKQVSPNILPKYIRYIYMKITKTYELLYTIVYPPTRK